jgi:hypothetical protein
MLIGWNEKKKGKMARADQLGHLAGFFTPQTNEGRTRPLGYLRSTIL